MRALFTRSYILLLLVGMSWSVNFVKFTYCDFEAPFRCEQVHGLGLVPGVSLVTVWFPADEDPKWNGAPTPTP